MTHEEIETKRKRLQALVEKWHPTPTPEPDDVTKGDFQQLAREVGASTRAVFIDPKTGYPVGCDAGIAELINNIHQALQTASMIDACRTAAQNYKIALKAQENARLSQRVSVAAMLAAVAAAIAAWVWH